MKWLSDFTLVKYASLFSSKNLTGRAGQAGQAGFFGFPYSKRFPEERAEEQGKTDAGDDAMESQTEDGC